MKIDNLNIIRRLWNQRSGIAQRRLALKKEQEKLKEETMETHRVSVTVTDPQHTMSTMRKEKIQKRVRVKARDKDHAIDSAINHYKKAGYKVHDHNYIGKVNEEVEELDEMDKSQPSSSRGAEGLPLGKKAEPAKTDKVKSDALKVLQKQYKKEEVVVEGDDLGHLDAEVFDRIDKEKKRKADLKKNDPVAYAKELKKDSKNYGRGIMGALRRKYDQPLKVKEEVEELEEVSSDLVKKARDAAFEKGKDDQGHRFVRKAYEKGKKESDAIGKKMAEEDVAVNNVGGGNIAGTQGDAGKKPVMTKEPLKRKKLVEFSEWIELDEAAVDSKGHKSSTGGLTQKGRDYYNNKTGGNLKAPVTTKPSKLDPDSKAAKRRKSFCARMGGMKKRLTSAKTANDPDSRINKALRKWNC